MIREIQQHCQVCDLEGARRNADQIPPHGDRFRPAADHRLGQNRTAAIKTVSVPSVSLPRMSMRVIRAPRRRGAAALARRMTSRRLRSLSVRRTITATVSRQVLHRNFKAMRSTQGPGAEPSESAAAAAARPVPQQRLLISAHQLLLASARSAADPLAKLPGDGAAVAAAV